MQLQRLKNYFLFSYTLITSTYFNINDINKETKYNIASYHDLRIVVIESKLCFSKKNDLLYLKKLYR